MAKSKKPSKKKVVVKQKGKAQPKRTAARAASTREESPVQYSDLRKVMLASVLRRLK